MVLAGWEESDNIFREREKEGSDLLLNCSIYIVATTTYTQKGKEEGGFLLSISQASLGQYKQGS